MKKRPFLLLGLVILLCLLVLVGKTLYQSGAFRTVQNLETDYRVEEIKTPAGVEDLDYDKETKTIFLSAHDRRNKISIGAIYSLKDNNKTLVNLTDHLGLKEFRPHGISFLRFNNQAFLFVISHKNDKDVVLKFQFENDSLQLINTYASTDFTTPNDIIAVGENAFYVSNDHGTATGIKKRLADFLSLPIGNVVYYDGKRSGLAIDKIAYPNGLAILNNKVYVSSTIGGYIGVYTATNFNFTLEKETEIKVPYAPDNLMVEGNRIYVGAHPNLLTFTKHAKSPENKSPSAVYFIENEIANTVFVDNGLKLSGSSTALPLVDSTGKISIYVGSVFEEKILKLIHK